MDTILNDSTTWGPEADRVNSNFAETNGNDAMLLKQYNSDWNFISAVSTTDAPSDTTTNNVWRPKAAGTYTNFDSAVATANYKNEVIVKTSTGYSVETLTDEVDGAKLKSKSVDTDAINDEAVGLPQLSQAAKDFIGSGGNITNNPDDIDLETKSGSVIGLKDGKRNGYEVRTIAQLDALIAASQSGTYVIASDLVLDGNKTLPVGVTLEFRNSKITFSEFNFTLNDTKLINNNDHIFVQNSTGVLLGNIKGDKIYPEWWGAVADGIIDCSGSFQNAIDYSLNNEWIILGKGTYLLESSIKGNDSNILRIKGSGSKLTYIKSNNTFTGILIEVRSNYVIEGIFVEGSGLDGCYLIGTNEVGRGGGRTVIRDVYLNICDQGVYFGEQFEHPLGLIYEDVYVQNFRTCGINLGGTSGIASSGESCWSFKNVITTNASIEGIEYDSSVSVDTPDTTHDRITWTGDSPHFGYVVMRSSDGVNDWHIPPNWSNGIFINNSFDAAKTAGEIWYYIVVRNIVGINCRRAKDVSFNACQNEYTGIGILLNDIKGAVVNGFYYENRSIEIPRPLFAAIYINSSSGISVRGGWCEGSGYSIYNAGNSESIIEGFRSFDNKWAAIGQSNATSQHCWYRGILLSGVTPQIFRTPNNYGQDWAYIGSEYSTSEYVEKISHGTKVSKQLLHQGNIKSTWSYSSSEGAKLNLNALELKMLSKTSHVPLLQNNEVFTQLTDSVNTDIIQIEVANNSGQSIIIGCSVKVYDGSSIIRQSKYFDLIINIIDIVGTAQVNVGLSNEYEMLDGSSTLVIASGASVVGNIITLYINAVSSIASANIRLYPVIKSALAGSIISVEQL